MGIKSLIISSNGDFYENLKLTKKYEKKTSKLQRSISRKKKGSKNREKSCKKYAKHCKKVTNIKSDYIHKLTTKLVGENRTIVLEDLNVKGMMKNHKLAKSIQDVSWAEIRRQLVYKAILYDREIKFANRFYASSKTCSNCGYINQDLTLNDRTFDCPNCKVSIDRDVNAASNLVNLLKIGTGCSDSRLGG